LKFELASSQARCKLLEAEKVELDSKLQACNTEKLQLERNYAQAIGQNEVYELHNRPSKRQRRDASTAPTKIPPYQSIASLEPGSFSALRLGSSREPQPPLDPRGIQDLANLKVRLHKTQAAEEFNLLQQRYDDTVVQHEQMSPELEIWTGELQTTIDQQASNHATAIAAKENALLLLSLKYANLVRVHAKDARKQFSHSLQLGLDLRKQQQYVRDRFQEALDAIAQRDEDIRQYKEGIDERNRDIVTLAGI
jgi:hypothetical protein